MNDHVLTANVRGMTCTSCENLISVELSSISGVLAVNADARRGMLTVRSEQELDHNVVAATLAHHGYTLHSRNPWLTREWVVWRDVTLAAVGLIAIVSLLWMVGVDTAMNSATASGTLGWALPLVVGLAAGVSTCMATVGGLVLAASAHLAAQSPSGASTRSGRPLTAHLVFNLSRVLGFVALGALTGTAGSLFTLSGAALTSVIVMAALIMVVIGVRLAGISPRVAALSPTLPRWMATRTLPHTWNWRGRHTKSAVLGVASFFVPCGFTQAMQLYALSTGDAVQASIIMGAFALGTAPALLSLAGLPLLARGTGRERLLRITGVAVIGFALINAGTVLGDSGNPFSSAPPIAGKPTSNVTIEDGVQVMTMTINGDEYLPQHSVVYADMPVRWEVDSVGLTCASAIMGPELAIPPNTLVWPGEPQTFEFTLDQPGTVDFACSMLMYSGTVTAIEQPPETRTPSA